MNVNNRATILNPGPICMQADVLDTEIILSVSKEKTQKSDMHVGFIVKPSFYIINMKKKKTNRKNFYVVFISCQNVFKSVSSISTG